MKKRRLAAATDVDAMVGKLAKKVSRRAMRRKLGGDPQVPGQVSEPEALQRLMQRVAAKAAQKLRRLKARPLT